MHVLCFVSATAHSLRGQTGKNTTQQGGVGGKELLSPRLVVHTLRLLAAPSAKDVTFHTLKYCHIQARNFMVYVFVYGIRPGRKTRRIYMFGRRGRAEAVPTLLITVCSTQNCMLAP